MPRYVLTGTPGAGKTAILRLLERAGYTVVEEAATDVIALEHALGRERPEEWPGFLPAIAALQRERQLRLAPTERAAVFDRSPVCTLALARFLPGNPVTLPGSILLVDWALVLLVLCGSRGATRLGRELGWGWSWVWSKGRPGNEKPLLKRVRIKFVLALMKTMSAEVLTIWRRLS